MMRERLRVPSMDATAGTATDGTHWTRINDVERCDACGDDIRQGWQCDDDGRALCAHHVALWIAATTALQSLTLEERAALARAVSTFGGGGYPLPTADNVHHFTPRFRLACVMRALRYSKRHAPRMVPLAETIISKLRAEGGLAT